MRTNTSVGGEEVLAVVLTDVSGQLTHPPYTIKQMIVREEWGGTETKDFLAPDAVSSTIIRGSNSRRRKCTVVVLAKLDDDLQKNIREGK